MRIAAIDIGLKGCLAITDEHFRRPTLVDNLEDIQLQLPTLLKQEGVTTLITEQPLYRDIAGGGNGVSKGFCTTWFNYGRLYRDFERITQLKEIIEVQPKEWQVIRGPAKSTKESKVQVALVLIERFPWLESHIYRQSKTGPGKVLVDGRSDALGIALWYFTRVSYNLPAEVSPNEVAEESIQEECPATTGDGPQGVGPDHDQRPDGGSDQAP